MSSFLLPLLAVLLASSVTQALSCVPCDQSTCEELPVGSCKGSVVLGVCGCCRVCARQLKESCGGAIGQLETCDRGLRCVIRPLRRSGDSIAIFSVGVCEAEDGEEGQLLRFEPCSDNLITGCNIQDGRCICHTVQACTNPFQFPSLDSCQTAMQLKEEPLLPARGVAGCYVSGRIVAHGQRWREDDCTFCRCVAGEGRCVAAACAHRCLRPIKVPGECCPRCPEPSYITMAPPVCPEENCLLLESDCLHGYHTDQRGCRTCRCRTHQEYCSALTLACTLSCPLGRQTDAHGCESCRCRTRPLRCRALVCPQACPRGTLNRHGCDTCRCRTCPDVPCDLMCPMGFHTDSLGCLKCACRDQPITASMSTETTGLCLSTDGRRRADGDSWHDGCRDCFCQGNREMCSLISCLVPDCDSPVIQPDHCCPRCPASPATPPTSALGVPGDRSLCISPGGEVFSGGEVWSLDTCTRCTCRGGQALCEGQVCPPLLCPQPLRSHDSCCPRCPDVPSPSSPGTTSPAFPSVCRGDRGGGTEVGDIFLPGESWKPDACTSCVCVAGAIRCFTESCPPTPCTRPLLRKGQCCPYCLEPPSLGRPATPAVCYFGGQQYSDEERWDIDACTHCYCLAGQTLCSTVSCPPTRAPRLPCRTPTSREGSCCPVCSDAPPTNVPIQKTDQLIDRRPPPPPYWPRPSPNHQAAFRGGAVELQMDTAVWVVLPLLLLLLLSALLYVSCRGRWLTPHCKVLASQVGPFPLHHQGQQSLTLHSGSHSLSQDAFYSTP